MSNRELRAKHGRPSDKFVSVVNRAIRSELIGGDEALDAAALLANLEHKLRTRNLPGAGAARKASLALNGVLEEMRREIGRRYDLETYR